jgi:hypothetical protein
VIVGINRIVKHAGREYHLQAEDLGLTLACFEVRVYDAGSVLWRKRVPYAELQAQQPGKAEFDEALRTLMQKTLNTVEAAIVKGKLTTS